ncbi:hypothetical protein BGX28_003920 [Mortierella sp. GBA30]|nr:hypothetical protein BGX28_003920 [Mortierella sp. GBA30]
MPTTPQLPLEIWFQILNQALNLLLPNATTPRLYSTYILPLLLTSHTFHEHCHPVTYPHLRKHKLLQLFTRWKAAHSREVHFYHHPLRTHVRYALPDRVGNPPGEEYETLYSFIKRSYLFGCESVCGTVIPVEGGLEGPPIMTTPSMPAAAAATAPEQEEEPAPGIEDGAATNATAATTSAPTSAATSTGAAPAGNVVVAPPPPPAIAPQVTHYGGDGGGQGWKGHALQWHVANPTFAAEGTLELYKDVVEEYRRVVCGSAAARERTRELERAMNMVKGAERHAETPASTPVSERDTMTELREYSHVPMNGRQSEHMDIEEDEEEEVELVDEDENDSEGDSHEEGRDKGDEDDGDIEIDDEYEAQDMADHDEDELLSEIEAKGGLRRRDSGHGHSSSEMDVDEDVDEDERSIGMHHQDHQLVHQHLHTKVDVDTCRPPTKRMPKTMAMDYQLEEEEEEEGSSTRQHRGIRNRKIERCPSITQERLIMDMALDKKYCTLGPHVPLGPHEPNPTLSSSSLKSSLMSASSLSTIPSASSSLARSGSPAPFPPTLRKSRDCSAYGRTKLSRTVLQRSHSSPGTTMTSRLPKTALQGSACAQSPTTSSTASASSPALNTCPRHTADSTLHLGTNRPLASSSSSLPRPLCAEDLDFDLASECANTFASDLAFVLARVPGLGAHFHRFEQLAKLKLHVGWAKHAQSRGGNDVFVMSCSRLIGLLAPLANTPLVSERGG